jgi:hypothetical protein
MPARRTIGSSRILEIESNRRYRKYKGLAHGVLDKSYQPTQFGYRYHLDRYDIDSTLVYTFKSCEHSFTPQMELAGGT